MLLAHSSLDDAHAVAARVRADVAASPVLASHAHGSIGVTVSIGLAASETAALAPDDLVARADAACYRAKAAGRDAIAVLAATPAASVTAATPGELASDAGRAAPSIRASAARSTRPNPADRTGQREARGPARPGPRRSTPGSPPPTACTMTLPAAVASTGPASTGLPVASAVA